MDKVTKNIEVKKNLTAEQKDELLKQISEAHKVIAQKNLELTDLKEEMAGVKEEIEDQYDVVASIVSKYDKGFVSEMVECSASYENGTATFVDKNGEIREQRPMTKDEQLILSEGKIIRDAEQVIRESHKDEE